MPEIWFPHLNIEIDTLNRICFTLFGVDVYWYGVFIALAFILGLQVAVINAKRVGFDSNYLYDFIPIAMLCAIVGARAYYVLFSFSYYKNHLNEIFSLRDGGLGVYGGIILSFFALYIYTRIKKIGFLNVCDIAIPGVALGQAIGRWGNFFNKEAFGSYTDNIFAMRIRTDVASFIPNGMEVFNYNGADYIQVHPTFLYESILDFSIFCFLMIYFSNRKFNGHIFYLYIVLYCFGRFFIESLRQDQLMIFGMPISMIVSFVAFLVAIVLIYKNTKRRGLHFD